MMTIEKGSVVRSIAGHDADRFYVVLEMEGDFAFIADGKERKLEKPKRKRKKHLRGTNTRLECGHPYHRQKAAGSPASI